MGVHCRVLKDGKEMRKCHVTREGKVTYTPTGKVVGTTKDCKVTWYADYYVNGQRVRERAGTTKTQAQQLEAIRKAEVLQGKCKIPQKTKDPKFEDFAKKYLEHSKRNKADGSYERDVTVLKALTSHFKGRRLSQITTDMVDNGYREKRLKKVSKTTFNRELATVRHMYNEAVKWGDTDNNPAIGVKPCTIKDGDTREIHVLNRVERDALLACSNGHTKAIITVALHTGMRLREILNLEWEDVDFRNGVITVKNTKSGKTREIPMSKSVREGLGEHNGSPFVYVDTRTGKPFNHIRRSFCRALEKAGIYNCCFHDLRHTAATLMVNGDPEVGLSGVDVATASKVLGHADIKTTMRYVHPSLANKRHALTRMEELLNGHNSVTMKIVPKPASSVSACEN